MLPKLCAKLVCFVMWLGGKLRVLRDPEKTQRKTIKTVVHNSHCLKKIATSPLVFFSTFLLSFGEHLANASIAYFTLKWFGFSLGSVGVGMEWLMIVVVTLLLYVGVSFIPTPGNAGAADLSFYLLFSFGLKAGLAFPAMALWRVLSFYSVIIIGFIFATLKKKQDLKRAKENPQPTLLLMSPEQIEEDKELDRTVDQLVGENSNHSSEDSENK